MDLILISEECNRLFNITRVINVVLPDYTNIYTSICSHNYW